MKRLENLLNGSKTLHRENVRLEPAPIYLRNSKGCESGSCEDVGSDYGAGCDRSGTCGGDGYDTLRKR